MCVDPDHMNEVDFNLTPFKFVGGEKKPTVAEMESTFSWGARASLLWPCNATRVFVDRLDKQLTCAKTV